MKRHGIVGQHHDLKKGVVVFELGQRDHLNGDGTIFVFFLETGWRM
jgi:hypothetical protein